MLGHAITPAGITCPPILTAWRTRRSTTAITGRTRSVSVIVASRYSDAPLSSSATRRPSARGSCSSRSKAQASDVAVVSCPANSKVTSSSRTSSSVMARPSSSRASRSWDMTPLPDLLGKRRVQRIPGPDEPRPRGVRAQLAIARGEEQERIAADRGEREDATAQLITARAPLDTEGHPHEDGEGDRLHARPQREGLAHRPASNLCPRDLANGGFPGAHAITMERGQDQLALAQVFRPVQDENRMRADQGLEDRGVGLAGPEHVIVAAEHGLHQLRAGDVDHVYAQRKTHGEHVTVGS